MIQSGSTIARAVVIFNKRANGTALFRYRFTNRPITPALDFLGVSLKDAFSELHKRIDKTASCRFNASNRMRRHHNLSLTIVILFSLGLIFVSLARALEINTSIDGQSLDLMSIFFSIAILVVSTALSKSNFGIKSEKFHDCGRELHALLMKIRKILADSSLHTEQNYDNLQALYEGVLAKYDNHKPVDYYHVKAQWTDSFQKRWYRVPVALFNSFIEYFIYFTLLVIEFAWLVYIFA